MAPAKEKPKTISAINRAFTFIELILVVLIIAALVGISLPRFRRAFNNLQLNNFAAALQDELSYWQERAIVEKKPVVLKLKIDSEKKEYYLQFFGAEAKLKSYSIPSGISMEIEPEEIIFFPDANITQSNITLSNPDEEKITLTTQGVFGGFKIVSKEE